MNIKTRFAPSPTGRIHLGNLRTALFNVLFAQGQKGTFMVRIEDTDKERSDRKYWDLLVEDLAFLGLHMDEGPLNDKGNGPYFQTERDHLYKDFYKKLEEKGLAYECYCTQGELTLMRKVQLNAGIAPKYDGTCRHLTAEQKQKRAHKNPNPVLRFCVPEGQLRFQDAIQGPKVFECKDMGDFIIRKNDGTPTFMFCNAIDDALQHVSHVMRGEDHLTNTPRQIMILQALGLNVPSYAHIPMIVGADGKPLSKRNGSLSVAELAEMGYLPIAVINLLARLGHHFASETLCDLPSLAANFKLENVGRAPAFFDVNQLYHWQKLALESLTAPEFEKWCGTTLKGIENKALFIDTVRHNILFPKEMLVWKECFFGKMVYEDQATALLKQTPKEFFQIAAQAGDLESVQNALKEKGFKGKALFMPLRAALSGKLSGPELPKMAALLGAARMKQRFEAAAQL